jgi:hypothetical protein
MEVRRATKLAQFVNRPIELHIGVRCGAFLINASESPASACALKLRRRSQRSMREEHMLLQYWI